MQRYFIELAYQGTRFSGFQKQCKQETVQGEVDKALATVIREQIETVTSSRTDAGVHAKQNFLHFDVSVDLPKSLLYNVNAILNKDIVVKSIRQVNPDAHSRFNALSRQYQYIVYQDKNPFLHEWGYFYPFKLNFDLLQQTAEIFLNNTNYQSFCKRNTDVNNYICLLDKVMWEKEDDYLKFTVRGNRFLRGMVRALVGTSLQIARGKILVEDLDGIISSNDCQQADFSAVAKGLQLVSVVYPEDIFI